MHADGGFRLRPPASPFLLSRRFQLHAQLQHHAEKVSVLSAPQLAREGAKEALAHVPSGAIEGAYDSWAATIFQAPFWR